MSLWEKQPCSARAWAVELSQGERSHAGGSRRVPECLRAASCRAPPGQQPGAVQEGCEQRNGHPAPAVSQGQAKPAKNWIGVFSCAPRLSHAWWEPMERCLCPKPLPPGL